MRRPLFVILLATIALAGCDRPAQVSRHTIARSLRGVMAYPRAQLMDIASGDSAGQMTFTSPDQADTIAAWYRLNLGLNRWVLQSDAKQPDGSILIYAERGSQPLWISLQRSSGAVGTTFTLTGAIPMSADTTKADSAKADSTHRSGSSMSSKRIQRR